MPLNSDIRCWHLADIIAQTSFRPFRASAVSMVAEAGMPSRLRTRLPTSICSKIRAKRVVIMKEGGLQEARGGRSMTSVGFPNDCTSQVAD